MYKKFVFYTVLLCVSIVSKADRIKGTVYDGNQTLPGVNIVWLGTTVGTATNNLGEFSIDRVPETNTLIVSFVGYHTDTINISNTKSDIEVHLSPNIELDEVKVVHRDNGSSFSRLSPIQSQNVSGAELRKAACCNLSESFETNASVDVSYADATTGAKQIKMLGLSGRFVQTITENMPSVRGLATPYGLGYIPGSWMQSIQVSKGTASVVNGYEAMTGQINVELKKPASNEKHHINLYGNSVAKFEGNYNTTIDVSEKLATTLLVHVEDNSMVIDDNNDGFTDVPLVEQINVLNRWEYKTPSGHAQIGAQFLTENRESGQTAYIKEDDTEAYGIGIKTNRFELFGKRGFFLKRNDTSLGLQGKVSYHDQSSFYGNTLYDASQLNTYFNAIFDSYIVNAMHKYQIGASFNGDFYDEYLNSEDLSHEEIVPGIFGQYTYNLNDKFILLGGVRADYSTMYGLFTTPRLHVKYMPFEQLHIRGNIGKGFRTANILAENSFYFASSREIIIDEDLVQEESVNMGVSVSGFFKTWGRDLSIVTDYYRTNFNEQIVVNADSDPHEIRFENLVGDSYSNAFQVEMIWEVLRGLTLNAAYRMTDVMQTIDGNLVEAPLNSKYKGLASATYITPLEKWQIDFTSQFNGGGRLPTPDTENPLWESTYDGFTVINTQLTKKFRKFDIYLGAENLANFAIPNPIIDSANPWGDNFDGSMAWGPVHGRKIYFGFRMSIDK